MMTRVGRCVVDPIVPSTLSQLADKHNPINLMVLWQRWWRRSSSSSSYSLRASWQKPLSKLLHMCFQTLNGALTWPPDASDALDVGFELEMNSRQVLAWDPISRVSHSIILTCVVREDIVNCPLTLPNQISPTNYQALRFIIYLSVHNTFLFSFLSWGIFYVPFAAQNIARIANAVTITLYSKVTM